MFRNDSWQPDAHTCRHCDINCDEFCDAHRYSNANGDAHYYSHSIAYVNHNRNTDTNRNAYEHCDSGGWKHADRHQDRSGYDHRHTQPDVDTQSNGSTGHTHHYTHAKSNIRHICPAGVFAIHLLARVLWLAGRCGARLGRVLYGAAISRSMACIALGLSMK